MYKAFATPESNFSVIQDNQSQLIALKKEFEDYKTTTSRVLSELRSDVASLLKQLNPGTSLSEHHENGHAPKKPLIDPPKPKQPPIHRLSPATRKLRGKRAVSTPAPPNRILRRSKPSPPPKVPPKPKVNRRLGTSLHSSPPKYTPPSSPPTPFKTREHEKSASESSLYDRRTRIGFVESTPPVNLNRNLSTGFGKNHKRAQSMHVSKLMDGANDQNSPALPHHSAKRGNIMAEIMKTESDYKDDLNTLIDLFMNPMLEQGIVSKEEHRVLFGNIKAIARTNNVHLYQPLNMRHEEAAMKWGPVKSLAYMVVGDIFSDFAGYLKVYTEYCSMKTLSKAMADSLYQSNREFKTYMTTFLQDPACKNLEFSAMLIKPIQRICRYSLLLRQLHQHTTQSHSEHTNLGRAIKLIDEAVTFIDKVNEQAESFSEICMKKLADLQLNIYNGSELNLVQRNRRLIKEGDASEVLEQKLKKIRVYLFTDMLLVLTKRKLIPSSKKMLRNVLITQINFFIFTTVPA
mmetsp:Transcript_11802/g.12975  ORF Transcript_11802/g.12975 Transcript_11802/m.12975 type:complete len:517 (+) Transcript_11802:135-1685(+)